MIFWSIVTTTDRVFPFKPEAPSAGFVETTFGAGSAGNSKGPLPPQDASAIAQDAIQMNLKDSLMQKRKKGGDAVAPPPLDSD